MITVLLPSEGKNTATYNALYHIQLLIAKHTNRVDPRLIQ